MSRAAAILFFLKLLGDFLVVIVLAVIFDTLDNLYVLGVKDFNICIVLRAELDFDKLLQYKGFDYRTAFAVVFNDRAFGRNSL